MSRPGAGNNSGEFDGRYNERAGGERGGRRGDGEKEPEIKEADWSGYFNGINGAAVLYDAVSMEYQVFNRELAETRRSPVPLLKSSRP